MTPLKIHLVITHCFNELINHVSNLTLMITKMQCITLIVHCIHSVHIGILFILFISVTMQLIKTGILSITLNDYQDIGQMFSF